MANVYAIASGNWSNTAIWNTGALPTAADDVFSNNFTVTVDQNITVLSLRNTASAPIVAGGNFTWSVGGFTASITGATPLSFGAANLLIFANNTDTITVNITNGIGAYYNGSTSLLHSGNGNLTFTCPGIWISGPGTGTSFLSKTGTGTLTLNGDLTLSPGSGGSNVNVRTITISNGNVVINGNCYQTASANNNCYTILQTAGNLTITGNIQTTTTTVNSTAVTIGFSGTGTLTINGNLLTGVGANVTSSGITIITGNIYGPTNVSGHGLNTSGTTTITGNIYGNVGVAVNSSSNVTVNGNVTTTGTAAGISVSSATTLTITGDITAGSSGNAVVMTNGGGILRLTGNLYNVNNRQAFFGFNMFVNASTPMQARFYTPGIIDRTLYSEDTFPNQPAVTNVRKSISYGPGSGLVGTLAMPAAADVRSGVVYDSATTGTALFTTALLLSEINSSSTAVAVRLRNASTPQILGTLLAAYKP